jgi:uncharacterized damage-inducible protein DinB
MILPLLPLLACVLSAQSAAKQERRQTPEFLGPCSDLVCEIEHDWSRNNVLIDGLANAMPEEKYGFKPTPAQQSFGERVLHAAEVNLMLLQALGAKIPPPSIDMKVTSKAATMAALERVGSYGLAVIKDLGEEGLQARIDSPTPIQWFMGSKVSRQRILYFLMTHSQDTYGQLVVYARLSGVTPPASRQP